MDEAERWELEQLRVENARLRREAERGRRAAARLERLAPNSRTLMILMGIAE